LTSLSFYYSSSVPFVSFLLSSVTVYRNTNRRYFISKGLCTGGDVDLFMNAGRAAMTFGVPGHPRANVPNGLANDFFYWVLAVAKLMRIKLRPLQT
jgi:hypothetical protein